MGVEFIVPYTEWTDLNPPSLFGQFFRRNDPFGLWVLHVWLWQKNPNGVFANWNPRVTCAHAPPVE
ncbi:MAG: hypothetical protein M3373_11815 [Gemmatimonadota bacterium]|nr:hypothetical protein [Gemmatimonadota bacterium]